MALSTACAECNSATVEHFSRPETFSRHVSSWALNAHPITANSTIGCFPGLVLLAHRWHLHHNRSPANFGIRNQPTFQGAPANRSTWLPCGKAVQHDETTWSDNPSCFSLLFGRPRRIRVGKAPTCLGPYILAAEAQSILRDRAATPS